MSKSYTMTAQKRDRAGKGIARALRRDGFVPAVIYGDKKEPVTIAVPSNDINTEYNKGQMFITLCDMDVEGKKHLVLARDIQLHPVTDRVLHADFLRVTDKTTIAVNVPVNFINEDQSPGLNAAGVLNIVRYNVELVCKATNIPDTIDVDMAGKEQGDTITISDAALPEGTKPVIDDRDFAIATLLAPKKLLTPEEEAAEQEAETGEAEAEGGEQDGASQEEEST
jgi:large subunit ribosomal protein L25